MSRGGQRKGAGRPRKEKTVVLSFRVPTGVADYLKKQINELIDGIQKQRGALPEDGKKK